MLPRSISILCLLQIAALIGSYMLMRKFAGVWDRMPPGSFYENSVWFEWMRFARWAVWPLLLVPAVLVFVGSKLALVHRGIAMIRPEWFWLCVAVTAGILVYSVMIVFIAMDGPSRKMKFLDL